VRDDAEHKADSEAVEVGARRCRDAEGVSGDGVVRAAGGVVVRGGPEALEVVIVHRPKYDDWTLPKGKTEPGESDEECAVREVREETGLRCELFDELESQSYRDALGRPKVARYWLMRPFGGKLRASHEVDRALWVPLAEAEEQLTYGRDVSVLRSVPPESYLPPA
jgi:8-oxo-dGTP diphosphatase